MCSLVNQIKTILPLLTALIFLFSPSTSYADEATDAIGEAAYSPEERLYEGKPCNLTVEWVNITGAMLDSHFQPPFINWWYQKPLSDEDLAWIKAHAISDQSSIIQTKIGEFTKYCTDNELLEGTMQPKQRHINESFIDFHSIIYDHAENIRCTLRPDTPTIVQNVDSPDHTKILLIMYFSPYL